jgi:alpha-mannosidase
MAHPRILLLALAALAGELFAQTPVDRLGAELDFQSRGSLDAWKYSTDFSGTPALPGFNDAAWQTLALNQSIYPDSCWIRKTVVLPERMLGTPTSGTIRLLLTVDDAGYLFVNGEARGYFPWDGEFVLTTDARPGQTFHLAIKAINTGGPLRLIRAQIAVGEDNPLARTIEDFSLGIRVAQKLLSFDTYQTNARAKQDPGTDLSAMNRDEKLRLAALLQSACTAVDAAALRDGNIDAFRASLARARATLAPVAAYTRRFTLYFDANAHIDAAWLWREKETVQVCRNTFASVMNMFAQRPDFTYTQSSAAYYDWMERYYPSLFTQIRNRVKEGRWEVIGGMWVEPDCNLPSGESWARHLLYGKNYFRQKLGTDVTIGWNPDSFGYNLNMPAFYRNAGITSFITQKIGWNETNVFPHRLFWWESPDGSRILSYFPFDYVNTIDDPLRLVDWVRQFEANTGLTKMLILFGVGDHGGGPSLAMLDRIDRLRSIDLFPTIEYGTAGTYMQWLRARDLSTLPVWKDELYLEYHQGTFTTQAAMKAANRSNETLLTNAEKASSFASLGGRPYGGAALEDAWKNLLFTQFHDILPGSGIREVYIDAAANHRAAEEIGTHELNGSLDHLAGRINTSRAKGIPFAVFNTLSWARTDLVTLTLPADDSAAYAVFNPRTKRTLPAQIIAPSRYERSLLFVAENVPACGYAAYELRKDSGSRPAPVSSSPYHLDNTLFHVAVDSSTGWLSSIVDKRNGKELLAGPGNQLQILEDRPAAWDAWNIGLTGVSYPSAFRGAEVLERGPVRWTIRLHRDYLKPGTKKEYPTEDFPTSFFTQDVTLYDGLDRIDFVTGADWWEEKTMLKVAFPLSVGAPEATYEIPYGTIRRSTGMVTSIEKARVEVPASRWADLSSSSYGVALLNNAKYGYDIKGQTMRLSLLRSPKWPDPTADRGKHVISYALFPHAGSWESTPTHQRGYEFNTPLLPRLTGRHGGPLPASRSFVSLAPSTLVLTSIKQAEDGRGWVLQWYNVAGTPATASLRLPAAATRVVESDFMESEGKPVGTGETISLAVGPHAITTVRVFWR